MTTTILVIEDDSQIRRVVEAYLQQAGYHVLSAADGPTGLALARSAKPALLILDLMLPGMDGWAITRHLRTSSDPALANLYIIMLTARVEETERVVGLEVGGDDYVPKPFSPRELVARVRAALRRLTPNCYGASSLPERRNCQLCSPNLTRNRSTLPVTGAGGGAAGSACCPAPSCSFLRSAKVW